LRRRIALLPELLGGIAGESLQTELPKVRLLSELFRFLLNQSAFWPEHLDLNLELAGLKCQVLSASDLTPSLPSIYNS
jgi:hypothetical protein